ncbi:MAG TPA: hypothetical protein VGW75_10165 [Solirubrobacteraceae bacterium]|jgi:hypothetical protein|nr:hypothetical protein [Solirubrobacteraceae bacterium]
MQSATLTRPRPVAAPTSPSREEPRAGRWAWIAFGLLCAGALWGFFAFPTYPNYDSYYSLLWGRELLDGTLPSYDAYRAPTPHPLAIAVGTVLSPLGHGAERIWILLCVGSFVALVAGVYRLGRDAFTPLVGLAAAVLVCSRLDFPFYAARGYIDVAYMALVVWAAVLEARRPRRGAPVLVMLAVAGMLRPEAWLISGLYLLWVGWPADWGTRVRYAALAALGPLVWAGSDWIVTGDPAWSLTYTSAFAEELGRNKSASGLLPSIWEFLVKLDKLQVLVGGIVGLCLAVALVPRRAAVPGALLAVGIGTFLLVGLAGFSVIDRYLLVASMVVIVFCGVAVAGWTMLRAGTRARRAWAVAAALVVAAGATITAIALDPDRLRRELTFRADAHPALHDVLAHPEVRRAMRCGPISVPNHKLIPDVRWILDLPDGAVVARSEGLRRPRLQRRIERGGVAIYPAQRSAVLRQAIVEEHDDPFTQVPLAGYRRAAVSDYYSAYVRC